ncbi:MAG: 4Fe-4S binding protein [Bacteroidales bacterium]|nr:4Fe-4S binding protein [Bacteroidales bacterium]
MAVNQIWGVYFSPTGETGKVVKHLAETLGNAMDLPWDAFDITHPEAREIEYYFGVEDLVVFGSPVYAGRLPNKIMPDYRNCFFADNAMAVPVVVFGNRDYGGALTELSTLLAENGFRVAGGAAVVSRHAFTDAVGAGRPDEEDLTELDAFALRLAKNLRSPRETEGNTARAAESDMAHSVTGETAEAGDAPGTEELPPYYTPLKEDGTPANFLKAKPETDASKCDQCGICRDACPMGSIDETMQVSGLCIKCQACVRKCPQHAKYFTDEDFLSHVRMLEQNFTERAPNVFIF